MRIDVFVLCVFVCCAGCGDDEDGLVVVRGDACDVTTGRPIAGGTVRGFQSALVRARTVTDDDGDWLVEVPVGRWVFSVEAPDDGLRHFVGELDVDEDHVEADGTVVAGDPICRQ